jgi:hypothetical protein
MHCYSLGVLLCVLVLLQPYLAWVGPHPVEQNGIDISVEVIWAFCPAILLFEDSRTGTAVPLMNQLFQSRGSGSWSPPPMSHRCYIIAGQRRRANMVDDHPCRCRRRLHVNGPHLMAVPIVEWHGKHGASGAFVAGRCGGGAVPVPAPYSQN